MGDAYAHAQLRGAAWARSKQALARDLGRSCWASSGSAGTTTSSSSAATRCWRCTLIERLRRRGAARGRARAVHHADAGASWRAAVGGQTAARSQVPPNRIPAGCERDHAGDAAAGGARRQAEIDAHRGRACRAARPTCRTSTRWRRCRKASSSITCWRSEGDPYLLRDAAELRQPRAAGRASSRAAGGDRPARHPAHGGAVGGACASRCRWCGARRRCAVEEVELDPAAGDAAEQLHERFDPRHYRLDLRQAPLLRGFVGVRRGAAAAGCCCCCCITW